MKSRNVKVIDEHNIDRSANIMFALDLEGSEYVVYSIERDEESSNLFVSKVLKNIDGTYNMLNIEDDDKKKEFSEVVKFLISKAVSDQNDKMVGTTVTLSNGKVVKFIDVLFNMEQHINVTKTYITTSKKEVIRVAENYYDVVVEEVKVEEVLPSVTPVVETVAASPVSVFPEPVMPELNPVVTPVVNTVVASPEVAPVQTVVTVQPPVQQVVPTPAVTQVIQPVVEATPVVAPQPVVMPAATVVAPEATIPAAVIPTPVVAQPVAPVVVAPTPVETPTVVNPTVIEPVPTPAQVVNQPLVFNAAKETNLNAALGEAANSTTIPVDNIQPVREFGVEAPVAQPVQTPLLQPNVTPMVQPEVNTDPKVLTKKAGFANSKFFMVVAIAFFLASCVFLGYEVYNYFQLVQ